MDELYYQYEIIELEDRIQWLEEKLFEEGYDTHRLREAYVKRKTQSKGDTKTATPIRWVNPKSKYNDNYLVNQSRLLNTKGLAELIVSLEIDGFKYKPGKQMGQKESNYIAKLCSTPDRKINSSTLRKDIIEQK